MKQRPLDEHFWRDNYVLSLDPSEKLLFSYLLSNSAMNWCGVYELPLKIAAVETGLESETVVRILERFERDGRISYIEGWVCLINRFKYMPWVNSNQKKGIARELEAIPSKIKDRLPIPYTKGMHTLCNGYISPSLLSKPKLKPKLKPNGGVGVEFAEFWKRYPKKMGKGAAEKAWKKIKDEDVPEIFKAIEEQKKTEQWKKDKGNYIPYPATWLNQKRWEDEITIKKSFSI